MKHKHQSQKHLLYFLFVFLFLAGCGDKDGEETLEKSIGPCDILTETLVRNLFDIPESVLFNEKLNDDEYCGREWQIGEQHIGNELFQVSLNYTDKLSPQEVESAWQYQNENVYANQDMIDVPNIGEKATWSKLGHGQLRVLYKGRIIYVGHNYRIVEDDGSFMPTHVVKQYEGMVDKTVEVAREVLKKF